MRAALGIALTSLLASGDRAPAVVNQVTVIATDYAFQVPREIAPGPTAFRLIDRGKVPHEFNVVLLKSDVTIDQFMARLNKNQPVSPLLERYVGVLFANPGEKLSSQLTTSLLPGRDYAVLCNFTDSAKAPPHFAMGMFARIHVRGTAAAPMPVSTPVVRRAGFRVDTIVANEYAFQFPRNVKPGPHTFLFRNAGKVRHEFNMVLLKKGATIKQFIEIKTDPFALVDTAPGVLLSLGGMSPDGQIDVDLLPGRDYAILCTLSNDDKSPPHFALGMFGNIHVTDR